MFSPYARPSCMEDITRVHIDIDREISDWETEGSITLGNFSMAIIHAGCRVFFFFVDELSQSHFNTQVWKDLNFIIEPNCIKSPVNNMLFT